MDTPPPPLRVPQTIYPGINGFPRATGRCDFPTDWPSGAEPITHAHKHTHGMFSGARQNVDTPAVQLQGPFLQDRLTPPPTHRNVVMIAAGTGVNPSELAP